MQIKPVFRRDGYLIRLFRVIWTQGTVGDGSGYSCKLSFGLSPAWFYFKRPFGGFLLIVAGLRVQYQKSLGGIHT